MAKRSSNMNMLANKGNKFNKFRRSGKYTKSSLAGKKLANFLWKLGIVAVLIFLVVLAAPYILTWLKAVLSAMFWYNE